MRLPTKTERLPLTIENEEIEGKETENRGRSERCKHRSLNNNKRYHVIRLVIDKRIFVQLQNQYSEWNRLCDFLSGWSYMSLFLSTGNFEIVGCKNISNYLSKNRPGLFSYY